MDSKEAVRYLEEDRINQWKNAIDRAACAECSVKADVAEALEIIAKESYAIVKDLGADTVPDIAAISRGLGLLLER